MRIALIVHGLPPAERTGVESHVDALAAGLARRGAQVCVLAARRSRDLPHLALRREVRAGVAIDWLNLAELPRDVLEEADPPGVAAAVGEWLDREQPQVVHVHHLRGLGWGLLEAVRARRLPLLFTAHDDYAVCHRVTRLRPDLTRCQDRPAADVCARCDRAVQHLHGRAQLGDWHMGVLPGQLDAQASSQLAGILAGAGEPAAIEAGEAHRARADDLRRAALTAVDLFFAPTRRLADALQQAGVSPARLRLQPYGIEHTDLRGLAGSLGTQARLRVGFFGGLSKHKGAHVLVEACAGLRGVELGLHGDSSDRPYVERLRARCRATGARWHGAYRAADLAARLAEVDLVCVPSLWVENAPLVIREAFAAGRPVLASDLGALPESVRDGVDGRLLPAGDVGAWRAAIGELARDRSRLAALAAQVEAPRSLDDLLDELLAAYAELLEREPERAPAPALPAHLHEFERLRRELAGAPFEELHARVQAGIARLRLGLGAQPSRAAEAPRALWRARDLLRDRRREAEWLGRAARDAKDSRSHLEAEVTWLRESLDGREREAAARQTELEAACEALRQQRDGLRAVAATGEEQAEWLRERAAASERERDWLRDALGELERERDWLRDVLSAFERERDWLDGVRRELERERDDLRGLKGEYAALSSHERWLRAEAQRILAALGAAGGASELPCAEPEPEELARALDRAGEHVEELRGELEWRRSQMGQALQEGGALLRAVLAPSSLGRRLESWRADGQGPAA